MAAAALPLAGVRVLDLTRILAGPWATQNLADLGAEVIKIENPNGGDDTRRMGPPFVHDAQTGEEADAAYFLSCNRGKESVAIDIASAEGRKLVRALAAKCDVLIENYKVGGLAKYGLDYASLHAELPQLVYCSITGFGQTGPYAERAGYDYLIQGMGGLMSVTGEPDGAPGGGPQRAGVALADILSGMYAALAIVAALRHRDQGGGGQHIDIGMLDVQAACLANQAMNYLTTGQVPQRMGNGHPNIAPYQAFRASDGHLILAVGNDTQFRKMAQAMGQPAISEDPRFRTIALRVANRAALIPLLAEVIATRTIAEWVATMEAVDVPCGPINTIDRVFADPQLRSRGGRLDLPHLRCGEVPSVANPIHFSDTPVQYRNGPPALGQHTGEVLRRVLGADDEQLRAWDRQGVTKDFTR
ncbi:MULTISPECIES: CaiB/BaiF CoA transferase family protein [Ramlibacter]|uniref:CoA transferase n=1 Tax=Ramlibacter pinisoli TaxID=2682844 RepID=A0A6N8IWK3_9BURK|nr:MULTISPECIES: CaiB/BaiF CoA-transferase family protein [Ramlibacter]MBA2965514.1 CoA transferase [Ramlibacter sp. CGMCC 1.13660]MVQ30480.1 CoA transferase [Ramlibacter pinisoli]